MEELIRSARLAAATAENEIVKLRAAFKLDEPEYAVVDDALLGVGWGVKRLDDLVALMEGKPSAPSL